MRVRMLILAAGAVAAMACGSDDGSGGQGPDDGSDADVLVRNDFFDPAEFEVTPGSTVLWLWASNGRLHNIDFDDAPPSGDQGSGTFERTFDTAGDYPYHCAIHGLAMSGVIHVVAPAEGSGGGGGGGTGGGGGGAGGGGGYPSPDPGGY